MNKKLKANESTKKNGTNLILEGKTLKIQEVKNNVIFILFPVIVFRKYDIFASFVKTIKMMHLRTVFLLLLLNTVIGLHGQERSFIEKKKILILNSYHQTMKWSIDMESGYSAYLYGNDEFELYVEYIDSRRNPITAEKEQGLLEILNKIYGNTEFDLILFTDDPALKFVNENYDKLLFMHDVPIIAVGINYYDVIEKVKIPNITIIKEKGDVKNTVLKIKEFFPATENIFFIADYSLTGNYYREDTKIQLQEIKEQIGHINIIHNENVSFKLLMEKIATLPPNTVILLSTYHIDAEEVYYPENEILNTILEKTEAPIFSLLNLWVSPPVIGGSVNSGKILGQILGQETMLKLGQDLPQPVISLENQSQWLFSYPALLKFGLQNKPLPPNSTVLYKTVINKNLFQFLLIASIILFIIVIIIFIFNRSLTKQVKIKTIELQKEIKKIEFFIEEMPIGFFELDNEYNVKVWNKLSEKMFGYTEKEMIGKNPVNYLIKRSQKDVYNKAVRDFNSIEESTYLAPAYTKSGEILECEWYVTSYQETEDSHHIFLMIIDVTEKERLRRHLEDMLEKTKQYMLQNDRFTAAAIHDLKNLFSPIVAYTELLMMDDLPETKRNALLKQLSFNLSGLTGMFSEMLNITKTRSELMIVEPTDFSIYEQVQDALIMLEGSAAKKGISIENHLSPEQKIYADEEMILSVILNLLNNAIKFTPQKGKIVISGHPVSERRFEVQIKDSGIGVEESKMEDLFLQDKYFTTKGTEGEVGSGLGLILCKDVLEKNNGSISVKNNEGEPGATFSFTLPNN